MDIISTKNDITTLLLGEDIQDIRTAADIIKNGGLVAFPTETVYGLGGDALSADSSKKIYAAKGRPSDNPLIVHIADIEAVYKLASEVSERARALMEAFWPGPLTVILPKKEIVPDETTGGLDTVAIRMPSHPAALSLIRESGTYIAAPSANTSGRPSPTTAQHVEEDMTGRIDAIIDGGPVGIGIESTIVDMTSDIPTILRPGYITKSKLEDIIGEVEIDKAILTPDPDIRPKAPGMKYTHYAPKGKLTIIEDSKNPGEVTGNVIAKINELLSSAPDNSKIAVLTTREHEKDYNTDSIILLGDKKNNTTIASRLYAALRECDTIGAELIYSESICQDELGGAVMNRLLKAAGQRVIHV
ncbi:L-threonylcarbamoyladenylate synthase [Lachnospiraceae bacterium]|nr:L-threonylcarbamoyladenylate synthase [Lachnospiraceae bacterium]